MSNPSGDYTTFVGLGFTALLVRPDGSQYIGYLYYGGEGASIPISNATYTDATGVVTFGAAASSTGVGDLNFTGNIILDMNGNVTAMTGTWTGRYFINAPVVVGRATPAIHSIGPILHANGGWIAFNRQDILTERPLLRVPSLTVTPAGHSRAALMALALPSDRRRSRWRARRWRCRRLLQKINSSIDVPLCLFVTSRDSTREVSMNANALIVWLAITTFVAWSWLKAWAMKIARRRGTKKGDRGSGSPAGRDHAPNLG